jgi:hypothetical protein
MKQFYTYLSAFLLGIFGLITLFLSGSVIFDLFGVRENEGNYVLFVVWANFLSSIIYLMAAYGIIKTKKWTSLLLSISAVVLIFAFIRLLIHINAGGIYETKTIGALIFRITVTILFAVVAHFRLKRNIA